MAVSKKIEQREHRLFSYLANVTFLRNALPLNVLTSHDSSQEKEGPAFMNNIIHIIMISFTMSLCYWYHRRDIVIVRGLSINIIYPIPEGTSRRISCCMHRILILLSWVLLAWVGQVLGIFEVRAPTEHIPGVQWYTMSSGMVCRFTLSLTTILYARIYLLLVVL